MMIKRVLLGSLAGALMVAPAFAADMAYPTKAPILAPAPVFTWTGFYVGGHVGYAWGDFKGLKAFNGSQDFDYYSGDQFYTSNDAFYPGTPCGSYCELTYNESESYSSKLSDPDGWFGGAQIGYNYQFTNNVVLGVEADISFGSLKGSGSNAYYGEQNYSYDYLSGPQGQFWGSQDITTYQDAYSSLSTKLDYFGTVRLRLGYAMERFLPYITGGFAWAHNKASLNGYYEEGYSFTDYDDQGVQTGAGGGVSYYDEVSDSDSNYHYGWVLGGGLEYAITDNWTIKGEYLYMDLGTETYKFVSDEGFDLSTSIGVKLQTFKVGVNYKF